MDIPKAIATFSKDNVSGAQALTRRAGDLVHELLGEMPNASLSEIQDRLSKLAVGLIHAQPAMASIFNLFNELFSPMPSPGDLSRTATLDSRARSFVARLTLHNQRLGGHLADMTVDGATLFTHSASGSVKEALLHCRAQDKEITVVCSESRPICEGAALARELARQGIPTTLTTDAMMFALLYEASLRAPKRSLMLVGADAVSVHGAVNKAGTLGLAVAAKTWSVPVYVLAGSEKFLPASASGDGTIQDRPASEIMVEEIPQGLTVVNRYFDRTPLDNLTGVICEDGVLDVAALATRLAGVRIQPRLLAALQRHALAEDREGV